jgi:hypothetical protein
MFSGTDILKSSMNGEWGRIAVLIVRVLIARFALAPGHWSMSYLWFSSCQKSGVNRSVFRFETYYVQRKAQVPVRCGLKV